MTRPLLSQRSAAMTVGKASAFTAAFIGVFVLGVAVGPSVMDRIPHRQATATAEPAQPSTAPVPAAVDTARPPARTTPRARPKASSATTATAPRAAATSKVAATEPRLHERLKPVLNRGAQMTVAAEGFRNGEEFAAVAHAARNTNVPFMVLKQRVVNEGRTLEQALHDVKPEVDAKAEVARAQAAAKSDVAAIAG